MVTYEYAQRWEFPVANFSVSYESNKGLVFLSVQKGSAQFTGHQPEHDTSSNLSAIYQTTKFGVDVDDIALLCSHCVEFESLPEM